MNAKKFTLFFFFILFILPVLELFLNKYYQISFKATSPLINCPDVKMCLYVYFSYHCICTWILAGNPILCFGHSWPGSLVPALGSVTFYQTEVATLVSLLFPHTEKINSLEREVCIWPEVSWLDCSLLWLCSNASLWSPSFSHLLPLDPGVLLYPR